VLVARIDWRFGEGRRHVAGVVAIVVVNRRVVFAPTGGKHEYEQREWRIENGKWPR